MAQIIAWNDISFALGGSSVNAVEDIGITGSCETEDSESGGEKFVKRKSSKPYEIKMKAILDAHLGVDVQSMAKKMTEAARTSTTGYFYTGSNKLFTCKFMMVEASISDIVMNSSGTWISCEVDLKLKQSTKYDGSTGSSSSGGGSSGGSSSSSSKKSSTKSSSTKKSTTNEVAALAVAQKSVSAVRDEIASKVSTVNNFNTIVKAVASKATTSSSSSSKSSTSKVTLPALKK